MALEPLNINHNGKPANMQKRLFLKPAFGLSFQIADSGPREGIFIPIAIRPIFLKIPERIRRRELETQEN